MAMANVPFPVFLPRGQPSKALSNMAVIKDICIYDSGCADNIVNDKKWFHTLEELPTPLTSLNSGGGHHGIAVA